MNSICEHVNLNSKSGFRLLNDYLITYNTAEQVTIKSFNYFALV